MSASAHTRWEGLLGPVFAAAHRALVRMEDEDVPSVLKPVRAASFSRSLPPPFQRTLAEHLEEGWLRELTLAELDDTTNEAAHLFLARPDGWEARLDALEDKRSTESDRRSTRVLENEIERIRKVNEELSERVREAESRAVDAERRLADSRLLDPGKRRLEEARREIQAAQLEVSEAREQIQRLRRDLEEADDKISQLRSRTQRREGSVTGSPATRAFGRGNPIETARLLDELAEAIRPGGTPEVEQVARQPLRLPPGVRPDSAAAIEWIRTVDRKVLVVVDGHNVAYDLSPEPGRTTRDRIVSEMARLRRLSDGPVSVLVFFDTSAESETHRNLGVTVRYVNDADSAIEEAAAASSVDCIVISTDKEVRARARRHGALALWGTALSTWIRRR